MSHVHASLQFETARGYTPPDDDCHWPEEDDCDCAMCQESFGDWYGARRQDKHKGRNDGA